MRGIVLAAGEGERCRPLTRTRPKVMLPVGNRPILEHVLTALHRAGVTDVTLVVGYHAEAVQAHVQDGTRYGLRVRYVRQPRPVGTADALHRALAAAKAPDDVLLVPGDAYLGPDVLAGFLEAARGADALLYAHSPTPERFGVVELNDDRVASVVEKPARADRDTVSTGVARLRAATAARVAAHAADPLGLTRFLDAVARGRGRLAAVPLEGAWHDVDRPEDLLGANALHLADLDAAHEGVVEPGASLVGDVRIGPGTRVRSGSYLVGPLVLGAGCEVGPHTVVYGPTTLGDNVTVGPFTELLECVVMDDARIASGCTLHHAVLDRGVVLAPRVVMDRAHAVAGAAFGAVVGDGTVLGNNVAVEAGSRIGAEARVAPHKRVGSLADGTVVV